jgi:D-glycero-D-manno-heptose 1,7-bisphosphate phosphatase
MSNMKKAVFLDKDGTLIKNVHYNVDVTRIELLPGVGESLHLLQQAGFALIVISNQPGVALGLFEEAALDKVFNTMQQLLQAYNVQLDGFYYCPHHTEGTAAAYVKPCYCKKPLPGLILNAAADHQIDIKNSWMIGDILHDVETGKRAGCKTILINNGNETEWLINEAREPDLIAADMHVAAAHILNTSSGR